MDSPLPRPIQSAPAAAQVTPALERRGRAWLLWSFLLCPCHLPLSLGVLAAVLGGTSLGAVLRDHAWAAGALITVAWLVGTGYGFTLIRRSQKFGGACPVPEQRRSRRVAAGSDTGPS